LSGPELWQQLQELADDNARQHDVGEIDHAYADDLVEALARHQAPDDDELCRLLVATEPDYSWLEIFLVDLAGMRRCTQAIPALTATYHIDTDYLRERTTEALARIGDVQAVRLVRAQFPAARWDVRLYMIGALERIHHPESEDAVLELIEHEEDGSLRTWLAYALCNLYSQRGVEVVLRLIREGYDTMCTDLREDLLAIAPVLGVTIPEADEWRKVCADNERRRAAQIAEWDERENRAAAAEQARFLAQTLGKLRGSTPGSTTLVPVAAAPTRVGRNERCPCGSGKKFKHCCRRKN
jgi:hypothetical protein